jgi:hypothetical protein
MPLDTCKLIVRKERLPELLWWTDLLGETTRPFVKLNQKKETNSLDTSIFGEGCRSLQNQDNLKFLRVTATPLPEAVTVTCPISIVI